MPQIPKKSVRKLVTLPPDLAERVEKFRESTGAASESEALKGLIEAGLKMRDRSEDLFQRCETATASGQSIGDVINLVTSDHPLVERTILDNETLQVYLKSDYNNPTERFVYSRSERAWVWQFSHDGDRWEYVKRRNSALSGAGNDLDDEIPF